MNKEASLDPFAVPAFIFKGAVIVSSASDLTKLPLSIESKVVAFTLVMFAPLPYKVSKYPFLILILLEPIS